jgi:hypothetical protein
MKIVKQIVLINILANPIYPKTTIKQITSRETDSYPFMNT